MATDTITTQSCLKSQTTGEKKGENLVLYDWRGKVVGYKYLPNPDSSDYSIADVICEILVSANFKSPKIIGSNGGYSVEVRYGKRGSYKFADIWYFYEPIKPFEDIKLVNFT